MKKHIIFTDDYGYYKESAIENLKANKIELTEKKY